MIFLSFCLWSIVHWMLRFLLCERIHCVLGINNCSFGCYSIATTVWYVTIRRVDNFQPQQHMANRRLNMYKPKNRGNLIQTQLIRTGYCRCTQRSVYSESSLQRTACKLPAWRQKLAKLLWTFSSDASIPLVCQLMWTGSLTLVTWLDRLT